MSIYLRSHLQGLVPYSSARLESGGASGIWLDANESPYDSGYNRYPDPRALQLRSALSRHTGAELEQILPACGSDQLIDMIYRAYCEPGVDSALSFSPGFSMYDHCADINGVRMDHLSLDDSFDLDVAAIEEFVRKHAPKIIFLCSPNNPTGNSLSADRMVAVAKMSPGIVVIDEAYIHYAETPSLVSRLSELPNVILLQTLSKAYGAAGLRLGYAIAAPALIEDLHRVKLPYDLSLIAQEKAIDILNSPEKLHSHTAETIAERKRLEKELPKCPSVEHIYPSDANFLLVRFTDHRSVYDQLRAADLIVRDRSALVDSCLRVTVGLPAENDALLSILREI